ncbi:MAG: TraU family protein [Desulfobulbus sp.]|nr:TraU family protein [Desulfobulbus sp.]
MKKLNRFLLSFVFVLLLAPISSGRAGVPFNSVTDIDYSEIKYKVTGICICKHGWYITIGVVWEFWEPFGLIDTSHEAYYSAALGTSFGSQPLLSGDNQSQDAASSNDENFAQAHAYLLTIYPSWPCSRNDYGVWYTEVDPTWQTDKLSAILTPESALVANYASQLACVADGTAANAGFPIDSLYWCVGSGGSLFPITGHVHADDIVQANSTTASRLIFRLCRLGLICDPYAKCGCSHTPIWVKSHYKMAAVRPNSSGVYVIGRSSMTYDSGLDPPLVGGSKGPSDEFLWVVYRKQRCCTCCE